MLIIADCNRSIMLEFSLASKHERKNSLAKIDRLAKVVNEFCEALRAEAKLLDRAKPESQV
jgi:hypothetical protein